MHITKREREILLLLAQDKTNREIAKALGLSVATVESHVSNICAKLGVRTRLAAVMLALAKGELSFQDVISYWLKYPGNP